ncbi:hypothetical protein AB833_27765 [Chromatiales bacterium (ex Bugula neritina AB1)]|nr:hypothetical protein AB833_27765 [Chromatiales bacterium (ex Bugula neritina AB1)]
MIKKSLATLRLWALRLKLEIYTLYVAMRDPRTPAYARYFAIFVVGYALSPIDLIPDFIPILGLLDDLILLPVGISLLRKMIPPIVMAASKRQGEALMRSGLPASRSAAMMILAIWALVLTAGIWWVANQLVTPRTDFVEESTTYSSDENVNQPPSDRSNQSRETDRGRSRER